MSERCSHLIWHGWISTSQCKNRAKMTHEGRPYCSIHDPVKAKARQEAKKTAAEMHVASAYREEAVRQAQKNLIAVARLAAKQQASWEDVAMAVSALDVAEASK